MSVLSYILQVNDKVRT